MRAQFSINGPVPANVDSSYGNFKFYKLGVCAWNYDGFRGQVEWINSLQFCTEPKYQGATSLEYWFQPGVSMNVKVQVQVQGLAPSDIAINGVPTNPVTGKNMPLVVE